MATRGQAHEGEVNRKYNQWQGRYADIGGRQYEDHSRPGDNVFVRPLRPNQQPSKDCCATTPHPDPEMRADGWRMEWIFLVVPIVFGFIWALTKFCPPV